MFRAIGISLHQWNGLLSLVYVGYSNRFYMRKKLIVVVRPRLKLEFTQQMGLFSKGQDRDGLQNILNVLTHGAPGMAGDLWDTRGNVPE